MGIGTILLLGVALSMDAFAVSVINSMCYPDLTRRRGMLVCAAFGVFQGIMPLLGYWAGSTFSGAISAVDHWIAFVLLAFIGGKMLFECIREWNEPVHCPAERTLSGKAILTQALATSIDALAVGVSFAAVSMSVNVYAACGIIAGLTFAICLIGCLLGKKIGGLLGNWAQIIGGVILIGIGVKILVEHLLG